MPTLCGLSRVPPARRFLKNDLRSLRLLTGGKGFCDKLLRVAVGAVVHTEKCCLMASSSIQKRPQDERKPAAGLSWPSRSGARAGEPFLAQRGRRLSVNDRRCHRPETTFQRPFIAVWTPHLDHGVSRVAFGQQQAR
jgi:hypothetical protein